MLQFTGLQRFGHDVATEQQHSWMHVLQLRGHGELSCGHLAMFHGHVPRVRHD